MKNKIMFAISTLSGGGAERVVSVWANELVERGYDITIFLSRRVKDEYFVSEKVKILTLSDSFENEKRVSNLEKIIQRRKIIKRERPDYLVSFLPYMQILSLITAWGLGIHRIETVRNSPWDAKIQKNVIGNILWRLCFITCDKVILQTTEQEEFFSDFVRRKCVVIPNPLDKKYEIHTNRKIRQVSKEFIAVGRIVEQKNYELMINAFANACKDRTECSLKIWGADEGNLKESYIRLIKEHGMENNIFFMGRTSDIADKYIESDVFLMSSNYEGMPNALAEAMANQLLCISTDCKTGPRDLIDDGVNGLLVPVNDANAFENAIKKVLEMHVDDKERMAEEARKKILKYCSMENSVNKLCLLFSR